VTTLIQPMREDLVRRNYVEAICTSSRTLAVLEWESKWRANWYGRRRQTGISRWISDNPATWIRRHCNVSASFLENPRRYGRHKAATAAISHTANRRPRS
jgi:hypothetical protein